jgi:hypothetical protein
MYKWQNLNNTGHEIYSYFIMEIIQIKIQFVNIFLLNMRILTECFYTAFQNNFNNPNDHDRYGIGRPGPAGGLYRPPDPSPQVVPTFHVIPSYAPG